MRHRTLKEWRNIDNKYVSTSATTFILKSLQHNRSVIITGSPGCGKSVTAHHVELKLEKKGYEIIPCDDPSEILEHLATKTIKVFVIDDVCGKFALSQHKADSLEQIDGKLNMLAGSCTHHDDTKKNSTKLETKFIITCRENIYVHKAFPKLTCLSLVKCSFSAEYKISQSEMKKIALSYVSENTVNDIQNICLYDFFPLLCTLYCKMDKQDPRFFIHPVEIIQNEISEMKIKSESSFLCLSLLVLRNNIVRKTYFVSVGVEHLVREICKDCEIESVVSMVSLQKSFERLKGIYIFEREYIYTAIHDKMFDIISAAIAPSMMKCLIKYGDIKFLTSRTQFFSLGSSNLPCIVYIPRELERMYLIRLYNEAMKGRYWEVFGSIQTENEAYRELLLSFFEQQVSCQQMYHVLYNDGLTPLFVSSSLGYVNFVHYFLSKCPDHKDVKDEKGRSPFHIACENGHIAVVRYLLSYHEDINAEDAAKTTALSAACFNGHTEVARLLLDNNADISRTNEISHNTLHFACLNGSAEIVRLLLSLAYDLDTALRNIPGKTAERFNNKRYVLYDRKLWRFCSDVNQKNKFGWTPLHYACLQGNYEAVKMLLDLKRQIDDRIVDTTIKTENGWSIVHIACGFGHTDIVQLMIDLGMSINEISNDGLTPLFLACRGGQVDTVKFLLDLNGQKSNSRVDTTIKSKHGWSVVHIACAYGHKTVAKLLVDVGMNINDMSKEGITPLFLACQEGQVEIVKFLLALNGEILNSRVDTTIKSKNGWSVLHVACAYGHKEVAKLLVDVGMNINNMSKEGFTSLFLACQEGHFDTVKFLLDLNGSILQSRVNTDLKNTDDWSVLHAACYKGCTNVVQLLIHADLKINDKTNKNCTPLYLACQEGHYDTVKYLLDLNRHTLKRVDITTKHVDGSSALHASCLSGNTEIVKLLVAAGMNVNDSSYTWSTPLHLACKTGHYDTVKFLLNLKDKTLKRCVDLTIKHKDGWSPLHAACLNGHTEIVKLLVDAGIEINEILVTGATPLYLACWNDQYDTVKFLLNLNGDTLNSRVDTTIKNVNGHSAFYAAYLNKNVEIVKLFTDLGLNENINSRNNSCVIM